MIMIQTDLLSHLIQLDSGKVVKYHIDHLKKKMDEICTKLTKAN